MERVRPETFAWPLRLIPHPNRPQRERGGLLTVNGGRKLASVARIERSEIRDFVQGWTTVPGFRCAQPGLRRSDAPRALRPEQSRIERERHGCFDPDGGNVCGAMIDQNISIGCIPYRHDDGR